MQDNLPEETSFYRELRQWCSGRNITQSALKDLVTIINKHCNMAIPSDPRTIMRTPRSVNIVTFKKPTINAANMNADQIRIEKKVNIAKYWHQGLATCLRMCFRTMKRDIAISININIDGLPIHNSTNQSFWPILFNIQEYPSVPPMAIGIFSGESKPESAQQYLQPFVDEMKDVLRDGLKINGHKLTVSIRCFICDSPARAFVKGTMSYNGRHGCQKCTTVGKHSYISKTTIFPSINEVPRTNENFRNGKYPLHHPHETPIVELPIDMIKDFIVADPLHLLELGVMKRLIIGWTSTDIRLNFGYKTKLSRQEKDAISKLLLQITVPSEIHRDARTLKLLPKWKGLEFRNFLNYFGIAVLKDFLPPKYYLHFLKLFCAVRFCSSDIYTPHLSVAQLLFDDFITDYKALYGSHYITSNMHNLNHVVEDVKRFGILQSISAYPFESALYTIKRKLRPNQNAIVQIAKRLTEQRLHIDSNFEKANDKRVEIFRKSSTGACKIQLPTFILTSEFKNMWFFAKEKIFKMVNASQMGNEYFVEALELKDFTDFFQKPFMSSFIDVYVSKKPELFSSNPISINVCDIKCKFVVIEIENGTQMLFIPLLHTLKNI